MTVSFKGYPLPLDQVDKEDKPEDMLKLGKVTSHLLRAQAAMSKIKVLGQ